MYWPNGVPRVYAVNGPSIPLRTSDGRPKSEPELETGGESPQEKKGLIDNDYAVQDQQQSSADTANHTSNDGQWAQEPITGVCASRTGHMFATMTESSMAIWQTKVCLLVDSLGRMS